MSAFPMPAGYSPNNPFGKQIHPPKPIRRPAMGQDGGQPKDKLAGFLTKPLAKPSMPATTSELGLTRPTVAQDPDRDVGRVTAQNGYMPTGNAPRVGTVGGSRGVAQQADAGGDFQHFEDEAYKNATERYLNPQWDRGRKDFDQSMINRGIDIGTDAYNEAHGNFSRAKNDAYSKAQFDAMGYGRDTQNMKFNQSATNANMANQMSMANMGNDTQLAGINANVGMANANNQMQRDSLMAQISQNNANRNLNADQFNESNQMARDSLIAQLNDSNANRDMNSQQFNANYDLNEMNSLSNIDMAYGDRDFRDAQYNAQRDDVAYNRLASMLSGLQQQGTSQLDTMGAYNLNSQVAQNNYNTAMENRGGVMGGLFNLGGALGGAAIKKWG